MYLFGVAVLKFNPYKDPNHGKRPATEKSRFVLEWMELGTAQTLGPAGSAWCDAGRGH